MDAVAGALSDPTRREILLLLRRGEASAGLIASAFPVSRPAISRHLRVLRAAGLVRDEARGRERVYRVELGALVELEGYLRELRAPAAWSRRFDALATEVHRVRRARRATDERAISKRKRRSA